MKRFLSLLLIALIVVMSAPAFAELESVTGCTDERIVNIVNAAYASGEYDYKVITYGQQMVDKIVNLNTAHHRSHGRQGCGRQLPRWSLCYLCSYPHHR